MPYLKQPNTIINFKCFNFLAMRLIWTLLLLGLSSIDKSMYGEMGRHFWLAFISSQPQCILKKMADRIVDILEEGTIKKVK
jgi:hypothetical protein